MTRVAVCELGPVAVRLLTRSPTGTLIDPVTIDPALGCAAVAAGDDPLTMVGDRAVRTAAVWRQVLGSLLAGADEAHLIHPSWWPATRPVMVAELARGVVGRVATSSRSELIGPESVHVEIAPQLVLIADGSNPRCVETRSAAPEYVADQVAARVAELVSRQQARPVALDAPAEVPGAAALADLIAARLGADGIAMHRVDPRQWTVAEPKTETPTSTTLGGPRSGWRLRWAAGSGLAAVLISGLGVTWLVVPDTGIGSAPTSVALVAGRIVADVPAGWAVRRVTGGPGSTRVEVVAPDDSGAVLHITQAAVPGQDLRAVAVALRAGLRQQPPGIFVDFEPTGHRAGRDVVTYREVRTGADIRWTVLVEDGIRIGIGCQSPPGGVQHVQPACELALRSAHRIR